MIGFVIIAILLWIRPEYRFLLFYVIANYVLIFLLFDIWSLTWADAPTYAVNWAIGVGLTILIGLPIVALFKWLKTRKTGRDKQLDREMEQIRADIAARESQQ